MKTWSWNGETQSEVKRAKKSLKQTKKRLFENTIGAKFCNILVIGG
jgi:hypothetical protein